MAEVHLLLVLCTISTPCYQLTGALYTGDNNYYSCNINTTDENMLPSNIDIYIYILASDKGTSDRNIL